MNTDKFFIADKFFIEKDKKQVRWLYYNYDADSGCQIVENIVSFALIREAFEEFTGVETFYNTLGERCIQYLYDKGESEFESAESIYDNYYKSGKVMVFHCAGFSTMVWIIECALPLSYKEILYKIANAFLADYYYREELAEDTVENCEFFDDDHQKLGIAYTDLEFIKDGKEIEELPVQAYADIGNLCITTEIIGKVATKIQFSTLVEFVDYLNGIQFNDLVYIEDEYVENCLGKNIKIYN